MKANAVQREPEIQKLWEERQILQRMMERNTGVRLAISHLDFSVKCAYDCVAFSSFWALVGVLPGLALIRKVTRSR